jgi:hypothetical protein
MSTAVADTCFLVHWLRFRERERIFEVFEFIARALKDICPSLRLKYIS